MIKLLFVFLIGLLICQNVKAQKQDRLLYYMKNSVEITTSKDSADFYLLIMLPADSSTDSKIYHVEQYYINGKKKLIGTAAIDASPGRIYLKFEGGCVEYYSNGVTKVVSNYDHGSLNGNQITYYPNGKRYTVIENHKFSVNKVIECRDSTGKVLAQDGNGQWIIYDDDFKTVLQQGRIKFGLREGKWIDSPLVLRVGDIQPCYKYGGAAGFNNFLARNVKFPIIDREKNTQGKVLITFVVEKDGVLSNITPLKAPSQTLADAVIRVLEQSPRWNPGTQNNMPVREQFTISFSFKLDNE